MCIRACVCAHARHFRLGTVIAVTVTTRNPHNSNNNKHYSTSFRSTIITNTTATAAYSPKPSSLKCVRCGHIEQDLLHFNVSSVGLLIPTHSLKSWWYLPHAHTATLSSCMQLIGKAGVQTVQQADIYSTHICTYEWIYLSISILQVSGYCTLCVLRLRLVSCIPSHRVVNTVNSAMRLYS